MISNILGHSCEMKASLEMLTDGLVNLCQQEVLSDKMICLLLDHGAQMTIESLSKLCKSKAISKDILAKTFLRSQDNHAVDLNAVLKASDMFHHLRVITVEYFSLNFNRMAILVFIY